MSCQARSPKRGAKPSELCEWLQVSFESNDGHIILAALYRVLKNGGSIIARPVNEEEVEAYFESQSAIRLWRGNHS